MASLDFPAAFGAGLISFLSPCVLPLVPGYLSYISGVNLAAVKNGGDLPSTKTVLIPALVFVLGFSLVFIALGATANVLGAFLLKELPLFSKIAGVLLMGFGLHMTGLIKIKALYTEKRMQVTQKPLGLFGALVVGMAFAFGWTPCIGPILAGILALASTQETANQGVLLLFAYSMGLGIPFILTAIGIRQFYGFLNKFKHHFRKVEITSGALLMIVGLLMFTGTLSNLATWFPFLTQFSK
jgi:cytochrome c-type biogenesis protein